MEKIFAPWRMDYIKGEKPAGCVLCRDSSRNNDLVVHDGKTCYVMVNRYPYTGGHLMIVPFRHLQSLADFTPSERKEMFDLVDISVRVLAEAMRPEGFNIGMNIGKIAGAGIEDHIHVHIVPRWTGDTNFTTVIGDVRVIPSDVFETAKELRPYFNTFTREDPR
jgi:ATP adenylyltransferase